MRRGSIFWGLVLTLAGVLLLLNSLGLLPAGFEAFFWPGVLILLGAWFLLTPRVFRRGGDWKEESASFPLENAVEGEIELRHGAGRLHVDALQEPLQLAAGTFAGGVNPTLRRDGNRVSLRLEPVHGMDWTPDFGRHEGFVWNVGLTREIPLSLKLYTGASESDLNLADLKLTALHIETGASETRVTLPAQAGFTRVDTHSGAAAMRLSIPAGVAARIRVSSGLSGIGVDTLRFPQSGSGYESPDYETAANRVEISVESGLGSVDIR
jgi:hypothetical protein